MKLQEANEITDILSRMRLEAVVESRSNDTSEDDYAVVVNRWLEMWE